MECDVLPASPRPQIQWFNSGSIRIEEVGHDVIYLEDGRFLFIQRLTAMQRTSSFHCEVVNAFLDSSMPQRSPTTYTLEGSIPLNTLETYIGDRSVTVTLGEPVQVVLAAAFPLTNGQSGQIVLTCTVAVNMIPGVTVTITDDVVAVFNGVGTEANRQLNVTCEVGLLGNVDIPTQTVTYSFNVARKYTSRLKYS